MRGSNSVRSLAFVELIAFAIDVEAFKRLVCSCYLRVAMARSSTASVYCVQKAIHIHVHLSSEASFSSARLISSNCKSCDTSEICCGSISRPSLSLTIAQIASRWGEEDYQHLRRPGGENFLCSRALRANSSLQEWPARSEPQTQTKPLNERKLGEEIRMSMNIANT